MAGPGSNPARKKIVHHLGSPFTTVSWPEISQEDQDTMLELLCEHRQAHVKRSMGKRAAKKRKRQGKESCQDAVPMAVDPPPKPEIASQVDVGFNSITNALQNTSYEQKGDSDSKEKKRYSMIFVCRGNQTAAFNSHFPQMVAASAQQGQPDQATRLVGFSKPCSDRLSRCLGIARVSSIAIQSDAVGSGALWDLVRKSVAPVHIEWLEEARSLQYKQFNCTAAGRQLPASREPPSTTRSPSRLPFCQFILLPLRGMPYSIWFLWSSALRIASPGFRLPFLRESISLPKAQLSIARDIMSNSYYGDPKKLADAIALAKSFSKTKPPKSKGKRKGNVDTYGLARPQYITNRPQHIQPLARSQSVNSSSARAQRPLVLQRRAPTNAIPITTWQVQKGAASITGGRGLDFLSRKDVQATPLPENPAPTPITALPVLSNGAEANDFQNILAQQKEKAPQPHMPLLEEFEKVMAQYDAATAETESLVDKLKNWNA
ncbi:hypothetical protein NLG97_g7406 [Lecanicillium saksenae]|uniref:Uncharacterized protein n=1 Tax=Lecanicillium saksenae TaxID=468837 RepID=A0ACC1QLW6_9HYPO|nr:hypothetical protein NLG97_g7406 [Lecanicillium saksenae]